MTDQLYKVTGPNLEAIHGGDYTYVPGEWTPEEYGRYVCKSGLYHLTTDPTQHLAVGCRVWEAEHTGVVGTKHDKVGVRSCRITKERPDLIPDWWRSVEDFIATIGEVPWLDPQGDPDPAWKVFVSWDAARNAAWNAARNASWNAARDAAWDAAWDAVGNATRDAAGDAARDAARDAAWDASWNASWDATRDAAWDAARNAVWDAAGNAALMSHVLICSGLDLDPQHLATASRRWDVWRRGYGLAAEVNGDLYVYRKLV